MSYIVNRVVFFTFMSVEFQGDMGLRGKDGRPGNPGPQVKTHPKLRINFFN